MNQVLSSALQTKELLQQISLEQYRDFNHITWDPYERLEKFKSRLRDNISEILIVEIQEDKSLSLEEKGRLPEEVQRFTDFSELRGLTYYILKTENEITSVFLWAFGGSTSRMNDSYMKEVLKAPELGAKTRKIQTSYRQLLGDEEK